jgi:hypothetical protein
MSAGSLRSWKRDPPRSVDEAAAASLLEAVRAPETLSPDALARIARRIRTVSSQVPHTALGRRARLAVDVRTATVAASFALLAILTALIWLLILNR